MPSKHPRPIFLISLPRSGSTLLQRLLAAHPQVSTHSEPWILLPPLQALDPDAGFSWYNHRACALAIQDFVSSIGGREKYLAEVAEFGRRLYAHATDSGAKYFLDKTPRYHLILPELSQMFPDARFVFLWRNPLHVLSSILERWGPKGKWCLYRFGQDLDGIYSLHKIAQSLQASGRGIQVRYEDLVSAPQDTVATIFHSLGLSSIEDVPDAPVQASLDGRMGDRTGSREVVQQMPRRAYMAANPLRRAWARRYLQRIGSEQLAAMGYDILELRAELSSRTFFAFLLSDAWRRPLGALMTRLNLHPSWRSRRVPRGKHHGRAYL